MTLPVTKNVFFDNGSIKRERENFQQYIFADLDLTQKPISFKRSDFRDTRISKCSFTRNNFNNADFIDSVISNTSFKDCLFRYTEFYNSTFDKAVFSNVTFSSASLVRLVFTNCVFEDVKMSINTFKDCKFISCRFQNCSFTRSSMDEIEYSYTTFSKVDLSGTTGINMYFDTCGFDSISIDPDYLGSYFFKGGIPKGLRMRYRGKLFTFDGTQTSLLKGIMGIMKERNRYYEMINLCIQINYLERNRISLIPIVKPIMINLLNHQKSLRNNYQLEKLLRIFEYYYNSGLILLSDYFELIKELDSMDLTGLPFETKLFLMEKKERLKKLIEYDEKFSLESLNSIRDKLMMVQITIDTKDERIFERSFKTTLNSLADRNSFPQNLYHIVDKQKGSIKYFIAVSGFLMFLLLRSIRICLREYKRVRKEALLIEIDYQYNHKVKKLLKKARTYDELSQIKDLLHDTPEKKAIKTGGEDKKEMEQLVSVMRQLIVKPNAFIQDRH